MRAHACERSIDRSDIYAQPSSRPSNLGEHSAIMSTKDISRDPPDIEVPTFTNIYTYCRGSASVHSMSLIFTSRPFSVVCCAEFALAEPAGPTPRHPRLYHTDQDGQETVEEEQRQGMHRKTSGDKTHPPPYFTSNILRHVEANGTILTT